MNNERRFKRVFTIKIFRNASAAIGARVFMAIISLLLIPFMVSILGKRQYGVLGLLGVASGYIGLLDVGFCSAFIKYISEYFAKRQFEKINQVINSGIIFYILWTILILLFSYFFLRIFLGFFSIPSDLVSITIISFWITIITVCISNIFVIFGAIINGIQRIDVGSFWAGAIALLRAIGIVSVLLLGWGIIGVSVVNLLSVIISAVINFVICKKMLPSMDLNFRKYFQFNTVKKIFGFGYKLQIANVSSIIFNNVDKTLIGRFCGLEWVTFYHIGSKILERLRAIPRMFFVALLPGFSEMDATQEKSLLFQTYRRSAKLLSLTVLPLLLLTISIAPSMVLLWLGQGFESAVYVIRILGFGYCILLFWGLGVTLSTATENASIVMRVSIVQSILNILLSLILVFWFGFKGVIFGTLIAIIMSFVILEISMLRHFGLSIKSLYDEKAGIVILWNLISFICSFFVGRLLQVIIASETRAIALYSVLIQAFVFGGIFLLMLKVWKPITLAEIELLPKRWEIIKQILKKYAR